MTVTRTGPLFQSEKDSNHHPTVSSRRKLRRLGHRRTHHHGITDLRCVRCFFFLFFFFFFCGALWGVVYMSSSLSCRPPPPPTPIRTPADMMWSRDEYHIVTWQYHVITWWEGCAQPLRWVIVYFHACRSNRLYDETAKRSHVSFLINCNEWKRQVFGDQCCSKITLSLRIC